jgi:hypothetical protein
MIPQQRCKEVVLKEFMHCYKHFDAVATAFTGREGYDQLLKYLERACEIGTSLSSSSSFSCSPSPPETPRLRNVDGSHPLLSRFLVTQLEKDVAALRPRSPELAHRKSKLTSKYSEIRNKILARLHTLASMGFGHGVTLELEKDPGKPATPCALPPIFSAADQRLS